MKMSEKGQTFQISVLYTIQTWISFSHWSHQQLYGLQSKQQIGFRMSLPHFEQEMDIGTSKLSPNRHYDILNITALLCYKNIML